MRRPRSGRQRGQALLLMLLVLAMGSTWYLLSRLNAESGSAKILVRTRNAEVLSRAKLALIGYVAAQANKAGENRPGALPCPEAPANFNVVGSEGTVSYPCALPIVGRFPWRTLGLDKLVDADGEPLWYAIAPGWAGANTVINSDCASPSAGTLLTCSSPGGRLTVDGVTGDVIALIIAPGAARSVAASANCAAWNQTRPATAPPDWRNYLECENASSPVDGTFVTNNANLAFNDQLVTITVSDLLPALEASIANRIAREIVPAFNTVYRPADWGFAGTQPLYPWAATFANPGPGAGTANYRGMGGGSATYRGLLPFNVTQCTASASNPRCIPTLVSWNGTPSWAYEVYGYGYIQSQSCYWVSADIWECTGQYHEGGDPTRPIRIQVSANFNYVTRGLRRIDATKITVDAKDNLNSTWLPQTVTYSPVMDSNGGAALAFGADLPNIDANGWGTYADFRIRIDRAVIGDHALLDTTDPTTGWFARNEWFRDVYYAVAQGYTNFPLPTAPSCTTGTNCLTVANLPNPVANLPNPPPYTPGGQRAILILAGRAINGSSRPSSTLTDYLEAGNATAAFTRNTVSASTAIPVAQRFNDRVVVIGSN